MGLWASRMVVLVVEGPEADLRPASSASITFTASFATPLSHVWETWTWYVLWKVRVWKYNMDTNDYDIHMQFTRPVGLRAF